jgi:hypothetical protein
VKTRQGLVLLTATCLVACSVSPVYSPDAGSSPDAALPDSGTSPGPDAGGDAGLDAGGPDAGGTDGGGSDAGVDAGPADGGPIVPLFIATTVLPAGQRGTPYLATLIAGGGTTPYAWTLTNAAPGISATAAGEISGTPSASGTFAVTASVIDSSTPPTTLSRSLQLVIAPLPGTNTFYVSPSGLDTNPGTQAQPWATLTHAQTVVQGLPKTSPITVNVRQGTYYLPQGMIFGASDSGDGGAATVTWQAFPGETPVLNGGTPVTGWTNTSTNVWTTTLPASTVDFENLYYNGERRLRTRIGAGGDAGTIGAFLRVVSDVYTPAPSTNCPDSGYNADAGGFRCYDRFVFDPDAGSGETIASAWKNLNPPAGNPCGAAAHGTAPSGDIEVDMFEAWSMQKLRVSCVDDAKRILYFTAPGPLYVNNGPFFGPTPEHRYMVENVQDYLQQPGQWFLDRSASPWKLTYLANTGENPNTDTVIAPQAQPLLTFYGFQWATFRGLTLEMDNYVPGPSGYNTDDNGETTLPGLISCQSCQHVTLDGLTVRRTSANAVQIVTTTGGSAASDDTVENSAFYDLGSSGVQIGYKASGRDTDAVLPKNLIVQNNLIQGYSRVFADGEGIATGALQDSQFIHNEINDGYHAGISVCNASCDSAPTSRGTANVASWYNRLWNLLQGITSDGGSLYYGIGGQVKSGLGNLIGHNLIHDVTDSSIIDQGVPGSGYGGQGIYLDSQSGGVTVQDNVVYRVSQFGFTMTLGPAPCVPGNTFMNNIAVLAREAMFFEQEPWPQGCPSTWSAQCQAESPTRVNVIGNLFYFDRTDPLFYVQQGCAYPCGLASYNQFQNFEGNLYWRTDGAFSTYAKQFHVSGRMCTNGETPAGWIYMPFADWQTSLTNGGQTYVMDEDTGAVIASPNFANPGYPNDDYTLSAAPVRGFDYAATNDTLQNAGRNNPILTAPTVPATFPTYHYDPSTDF